MRRFIAVVKQLNADVYDYDSAAEAIGEAVNQLKLLRKYKSTADGSFAEHRRAMLEADETIGGVWRAKGWRAGLRQHAHAPSALARV